MAFTLNSAVAYGVEAEEPLNKQYTQKLILDIANANSDLKLDIGDPTGAFWTAVKGTVAGAQALEAALSINTKAKAFLSARSTALAVRIQVLTNAAVTDYKLTMNGTNALLPVLDFYTAGAPTAQVLVIEWLLKPNEVPVYIDVKN